MNEQKNITKILYIIIAIIIIVGAIICIVKGFNISLDYSSRQEITIADNLELDKSKVEEISKEVLNGKKVRVQEVERFSNALEIISTEISEDEKNQIVTKVNEQLGASISSDDITIESVPNTRIRDILKPYMLPAIITFALVLLYFVIVYHKIGLKYILLRGIFVPIIAELFFYSIIAIVRIPFGIVTNAIAIGIYIFSVKCIGTLFQNKKDSIPLNEQKENE